MNSFKINKKYIRISIVLLIIVFFGQNLSTVRAAVDKPNLTITYNGSSKTTSTDISGTVNEEVTLNYTVTPGDLDVGDVNAITNKEIVLVLDTSGSMKDPISSTDKTVRIEALKTAASNFIDKFKSDTNVKIAIATYSTKANYDGNSIGLTSSTQVSTLKGKINNLQADGGTNIGDGIRYALNILSTGNSNAKKYVILMSDGEPTFYMYNSKKTSGVTPWTAYDYNNRRNANAYGYYTQLVNDSSNPPVVGGYGNGDSDGRSLEYASIMSSQIKNNKYSSYQIAYSSGSSSDKMQTLSSSAGGSFYSALDANAINKVYDDIADEIRADYLLEGIKLNFTLPNGLNYAGSLAELTINGSTYTKQLPNIVYTLNADKTKYTATPFPIQFTFKASQSGVYTLGNGWTITYNGVDGKPIVKNMPVVSYSASKLNLNYNLSRELVGYTGKVSTGQVVQMNYKVEPQNITVTNTRKPKEVVLVVDSAFSNKNNIKDFINRFANIADAKFSLIVYDTGAKLYNFGTSDKPSYFVGAGNSSLTGAIDSIGTSSGSNLGDGLRKALFVLNNKDDVNRSIVVFGENNTNYYTYTRNDTGTENYYQELDDLTGSTNIGTNTLIYGNDSNKASDYAKKIAQTIIDTKNLAISMQTVGDGKNDEVLNDISSISSTEFNKIMTSDDIQKLFNIINSDLILDARINEIFPQGIVLEDGSNTFNKNVKLFYNYDNVNKYYTANPITAIANIKGNSVGQFNLNNARFYYKDLEGIELSKSFDSLAINVENNTVLEQGMFKGKDASGEGTSSVVERYLDHTSGNKSIALNSSMSMGAYIKTSLQNPTIRLEINSASNSSINISNLTLTVFKVGDNGELTESQKITPEADISSKKVTSFILNNIGENSYIVNYTYKVSNNPSVLKEEQLNSPDSRINLQNDCYVGSDYNNSYYYNIIGLPDLF